MNKINVFIFTFSLILGVGGKAQAAFYLEPFAGMLVSSSYELELNSTSIEGKVDGSQVGGRVGYTKMGFSLGLDGRRTSLKIKPDSDSYDDQDYTATQSGFFVGYELPIGLRFWANYVFSSEASNDDDSERKFKEGSGHNIGIGYQPIPLISINLEMFQLNYAKYENALGEQDADFVSSGMVLGISVPVSI